MKKWVCAAAGIAAVFVCIFVFQVGVRVQASEDGEDYIHNGIFIGDIDVSGMKREEARDRKSVV